MPARRTSLRSRIALWFGTFVALSMLLLGATVGYRLIASLNSALEEQSRELAAAHTAKLAQRFDYLLESAQGFAKNPLLVNGISESQARQTILPPLVENFMTGRDVRAVALLDFDGRPVYSSLPNLPTYSGSSALRAALNQAVTGQEIDLQQKRWRLFVPLMYYNTTQGALLIDYDLPAITARVLTRTPDVQDSLSSQGQVLYVSDNRLSGRLLRESRPLGDGGQEALRQLDLTLEVTMSRDRQLVAASAALRDVALMGFLLTGLAIMLASWLGHRLAQPIMLLRRRVALADGTPERRCAPLGSDDELEELAQQFDQRTEALREDEERLQLATRAAGIGVWDWDIINGKLLWDEGMHRLYGTPSFDNTYAGWKRCIYPDDAATVESAIQAALQGGKEYAAEFRIVRADGEVRVIQAASKTSRSNSGTPLRMIGTNIDITERKRDEAELKAHRNQLEAMVEQRTAALEQANKELESFSYSVSHDLRAPLRAIEGFSKILLEDYETKLDDEGKHLLDVIRSNTLRMGRLIEDILSFSRMSRQQLAMSPVDMAALTEEVFDEALAAAPERKIELRLGELPTAEGDRAMLRQVMVNLLGNAIKYTAPRAEAIIEVDGRCEDGEIVYRVKDNGVGFDMQYVDRLFGVFQRLHTAEEFEGTGIGLAVVKCIVARHGGRVWAEGKVGEGACIYFTLRPAGGAA